MNSYTLDYSRVKDSGKALNFRISYGEQSSISDYSSQIVAADLPDENPILSQRFLAATENRCKLAIGPEYRIRGSNFYWGIEGLLGVGVRNHALTEQILETDDEGFITEPGPGFSPLVANNRIIEKVDRLLFSPGLQGRISFNTDFTKNLGLQLFISSSLEQDIITDTKSSFTTSVNELSTGSSSSLNLNARIGITMFFKRG